jgi:hypothetical protein
MNKPTMALAAVTAVLMSYYIWSLLVGSRYQALCNVTYLQAGREQIEACKDVETELDGQK